MKNEIRQSMGYWVLWLVSAASILTVVSLCVWGTYKLMAHLYASRFFW
jgi:hypothetical protein